MGQSFSTHIRRAARLAGIVAAVSLLATACQTTDNGGGGGGSSGGGGDKKIALLLPETKTTRYEAQDRPLFEAKVKALCSDCQIIYSNADQKADQQQNQADAALTNGAKVMVLDPVDSASAASIVSKAKAQNVPVISYDRLILSPGIAIRWGALPGYDEAAAQRMPHAWVPADGASIGLECTSLHGIITLCVKNKVPRPGFAEALRAAFEAEGIKVLEAAELGADNT